MPQHETLIDCLAKTGEDQHLKLILQGHILLLKPFWRRNIVSLPGKYLWQTLFKSPQALFFPSPSPPPLSKFGTES